MSAGVAVVVTVDITREIMRRGIVVEVGRHTLRVRYQDGSEDVINRMNARKV